MLPRTLIRARRQQIQDEDSQLASRLVWANPGTICCGGFMLPSVDIRGVGLVSPLCIRPKERCGDG